MILRSTEDLPKCWRNRAWWGRPWFSCRGRGLPALCTPGSEHLLCLTGIPAATGSGHRSPTSPCGCLGRLPVNRLSGELSTATHPPCPRHGTSHSFPAASLQASDTCSREGLPISRSYGGLGKRCSLLGRGLAGCRHRWRLTRTRRDPRAGEVCTKPESRWRNKTPRTEAVPLTASQSAGMPAAACFADAKNQTGFGLSQERGSDVWVMNTVRLAKGESLSQIRGGAAWPASPAPVPATQAKRSWTP